jgi:hypothetical protein
MKRYDLPACSAYPASSPSGNAISKSPRLNDESLSASVSCQLDNLNKNGQSYTPASCVPLLETAVIVL